MRIYIAGPMTGMPDFNYPTFRAVAARLTEAGFIAVSPLDNGLPTDAPWAAHMRADLPMLMTCDGVAMMDGWQASKGANVERNAAMGVGIWCMPVNAWLGVARAVRAVVKDAPAQSVTRLPVKTATDASHRSNYADGLVRSVTSFLRGGA